jgi:cytochrome oxidase assembly protein ShyY1
MALTALFACAVSVWLGFWQLGRLAARQEVNAQLAARLHAGPAMLSDLVSSGVPSGAGLKEWEFRPVVLRGAFDYAAEVAVANQFRGGQLGLHLLTPLVLEDGEHAVLVNRGWVPAAAAQESNWVPYQAGHPTRPGDPAPIVEVSGWIRLSRPGREPLPRSAGGSGGFGIARATGSFERIVPTASVEQIQTRVGYPLLPLVVVQAPEIGAPATASATPPPAGTEKGDLPPYREPLVASLGEGVHLIAAAQWFIIAGIIVVGLFAYIRRHTPATK